MSVLVTGGAGYVGSHMVKLLLARGHAVAVYDNLSRGHRDAVLCDDFFEGDLLHGEPLDRALRSRRFDVVMHFAALCYVGESVQRPLDYYRNNVSGTLNLVDAMLRASVRKLVFSSTCSTYGNPVEVPIRERHPQAPINPYGASKLAVETALRHFAAAGMLDSVALRYFNAAGSDPEGVIGERHDPETHLIPLALLEALRVRDGGDPAATTLVVHGGDYDTPDGTCVRDYVHVEDLAQAHLLAAEGLVSGALPGMRAFNLGADRGFSVLEVIAACRDVTGIPIEYRMGPRRPGDPPLLVADSSLARTTLGWRPSRSQLDKIVASAWAWFSSPARGAANGRCTSSA